MACSPQDEACRGKPTGHPHTVADQPMNDLAEHLSDEDEVVEQLQWVACRRTEIRAEFWHRTGKAWPER